MLMTWTRSFHRLSISCILLFTYAALVDDSMYFLYIIHISNLFTVVIVTDIYRYL